MEFSTLARTCSQLRQGHNPAWLQLAIANLSLLTPDAVVCRCAGQWNAKPLNKARSTNHYYHGGLGSHGFFEFSFMLYGEAMFDFDHQRYALQKPALAIITPHIEHCEGHTAQKHPYAMAWIAGFSTSLTFSVSRFSPEIGWDISTLWHFQNKHFLSITQLLEQPCKLISLGDFELLRASLLVCITEFYHTQINGQAASLQVAQSPIEKHLSMLKQVKHYLDNNLRLALPLDEVADMTRMSPNYVNKLFAKWTGESIHAYLIRQRMEKAMQLCQANKLLVKQIALQVGYDDALYFSKAFKKYFGQWPTSITSKK